MEKRTKESAAFVIAKKTILPSEYPSSRKQIEDAFYFLSPINQTEPFEEQWENIKETP